MDICDSINDLINNNKTITISEELQHNNKLNTAPTNQNINSTLENKFVNLSLYPIEDISHNSDTKSKLNIISELSNTSNHKPSEIIYLSDDNNELSTNFTITPKPSINLNNDTPNQAFLRKEKTNEVNKQNSQIKQINKKNFYEDCAGNVVDFDTCSGAYQALINKTKGNTSDLKSADSDNVYRNFLLTKKRVRDLKQLHTSNVYKV